jgi:hypothetical protein
MSSAEGASAESVRPLPPHPDVEFEKKRAKHLLRDAKAGDADALRAMARVAEGTPPEELTLSLAQLAVAREYGFSSWVKLGQYYEMWARHAKCPEGGMDTIEMYENRVQRILGWHTRRIPVVARTIATFLPRLYGKSVVEVFSTEITVDEARFIAAREDRRASWDEITRFAQTTEEARKNFAWKTPFGEALRLMREKDLAKLQSLTTEHPELLGTAIWNGGPDSLLRNALIMDLREPTPESRAIREWLETKGKLSRDAVQENLDLALARLRVESAEEIENLIRQGANPNWVSPAGVSTLEYALVMYNLGKSRPELVDTLARHVNPVPRAFWISAGLGRLDETMSYFAGRGKLKPAAYERRIDWNVMMPSGSPHIPDPTDADYIWDALLVAAMNSRADVVEAIIRGGHFDIDSSPMHYPLLHCAVAFASYPVCEVLLRLGADPDLIALYNGSSRKFALSIPADMRPPDRDRDRIAELFKALPPRPDGPDRFSANPPPGMKPLNS